MNKIPILILHGWNLTSNRLLPLKTELEIRGYNVYCPDLPGFEYSTVHLKPLYLSDYIDFIKNYTKKNNLGDFILIGHSFGGRIGIKYASQNPENLKILILTGVPGINPVPTPKIIFFLILAKIGRLIFSFPMFSNVRDIFRKLLYKLANASDYYNTNDFMLETFKNTINESLEEYMSQISMPTLLLWGRDDGIVPLDVAEKMNKIIKNSELAVIKEARHGVPWTHPNEFADMIEKFLKKL